jgi:hypothetical protein
MRLVMGSIHKPQLLADKLQTRHLPSSLNIDCFSYGLVNPLAFTSHFAESSFFLDSLN